VTDNNEIAEIVRPMINFGYSNSQTGEIGTIVINAKMNEFEAAMGLAMLDDMEYIISFLRKNYNLYKELLEDCVIFQRIRDRTGPNYMYVPVLFKDERTLIKVKAELNKNNIYPRRYFYPSLDMVSYVKSSYNCQISRDVSSRILCLPNYVGLDEDIIIYISDKIKGILTNKSI